MRRVAGVLFVAALAHAAAAAELPNPGKDGWYTWQVEAVDDAPAWCCLAGFRGPSFQDSCDLDESHAGYGSRDDRTVDGAMRIYARFESGTLATLRALSPSCPVESASGISDLGTFAPGESVAWLQGVAAQDSRVAGDAMAVIAVHRGEAALGFLLDAAAGGGVDDLRRDAIFWLGQVRIGEASADIQHLMFNDDLPHIRQHAAFSLAQSRFPERAKALIRQGRDDGDAEVRSQAWFWLAQIGAKESERAISGAIVADPDREVRNKAVFALSQLPGERGVDALFAVLDDRRMEREVREQALFWLVQSESDRAFAYVDRLLTEAPL